MSHHHLRLIVVSIGVNLHIIVTILDDFIIALALFLIKIYSPCLIINSEENKNYRIKRCHLSPEKAISIYNPKDIDKIQSLQAETIEDNFINIRYKILLNICGLTPQKGQMHLLRISSKLRQSNPCLLVISGYGKLESQLKSLFRDLDVEQYVLFIGWYEIQYKHMNHADIIDCIIDFTH